MPNAILIDPAKRTVSQVDVPSDWDSVKALIGADLLETPSLGDGVFAYVDEEGSFKDWDTVGVFLLAGGLQLWGKTVLAGRVPGDSGDVDDLPVRYTLESIRNIVEWLDPKNVVCKGAQFIVYDKEGTEKRRERLGPDRRYENQQEGTRNDPKAER